MLTSLDGIAMSLGQAIDIVVIALDAEILRQVDDLDIGRDLMFLEECLALAMAEAEEHHIDLVERHVGRETEIGIANQTLVHIRETVASIAL